MMRKGSREEGERKECDVRRAQGVEYTDANLARLRGSITTTRQKD